MTASKLKALVKFITASAVSFLFFVIVVIGMQYIKLGELKSLENVLENELATLANERNELTSEVSYMQTQEYVEQYAREVLGWGKSGETKFVASD